MTGYGRGQSVFQGAKFTVELNSVNRKQSDVVINIPRELAELEPRVRDAINAEVTRGRLTVVIAFHAGATTQSLVEAALGEALADLLKMREHEGAHLAKDLGKRLKIVRDAAKKVRKLQPGVLKRYRQNLQERIHRAGLELSLDDERLVKEVVVFADKSDISEELTRLDSHFEQFAIHLGKNEPVGRTLEFMCQEIGREFNTLGSKANDVEISQLVVTCKAEMEKIREQIQNIE